MDTIAFLIAFTFLALSLASAGADECGIKIIFSFSVNEIY